MAGLQLVQDVVKEGQGPTQQDVSDDLGRLQDDVNSMRFLC